MASSGTSITTPAIIETGAPTNGGRERRRSSSPFGHLLHLTNGLQSGEYYIGPRLNTVSPSPVRSVSEYIAKKTDGDEFVTMKILSLSPGGMHYVHVLGMHVWKVTIVVHIIVYGRAGKLKLYC